MKHASRADADARLAAPFPPAPNLKADNNNWLSQLIDLWATAVVVEKHLVRLSGGRTRKDFLRLCYGSEKRVLLLGGNLLRYGCVRLFSKRKRSCIAWRDHILVDCFDS